MSEFENIPEMIPENPQNPNDPYTYYAGKPAEPPLPRYVPIYQKKKKKLPWGLILVVALICALFGGVAGACGVLLIQDIQTEDVPETDVSYMMQSIRGNTAIEIVEAGTGQLMTPAEVYAANVGSTVGITTSVTTNIWGFQTTSAASGSGFIISTDGYILTNYHVIDDADSITVALFDGTTYDAALIGYDESNDIAVLKVEAENLSPVILGNSDQLNVGDQVLAIGNPLGELTFSLTSGAISAKDREITMSNGATMQLMQTDCAINSGNSGGALFNLYGEVIGITNAKYSSSSSSSASIDNIGFAIPINKARSIAESIIEKGYVSKPYIGVSVTTVSTETQSYGLPQGAAVKSVAENSPAAVAGLKINDIITHINDSAITGSSELVSYIGNAKPGDQLNLTVYRQGSTQQLTITVGEQIQSATNQGNNQNQSQMPQYNWGYGN
jgi:serine protease Do